MRFDYDPVTWEFVSRIMTENNHRLSRTHSGKSDTGSSKSKHPLLLSGAVLKDSVRLNEQNVHRFIFENRKSPIQSIHDVHDLLFRIADMTNEGLLPAGRFRTWSIGANQRSHLGGAKVSGPEAKVSPEDIPEAVDHFCELIWKRWDELESDPIPLISWAEWELNGGSLHPFYDGCGRISRSYAAALLVKCNILLPLFDSRETYFSAGNLGIQSFCKYFLQKINHCRSWLDS